MNNAQKGRYRDECFGIALQEAHVASAKVMASMMPEPQNTPAGMAWVTVKPMSHPFVQYLKKRAKDGGYTAERVYGAKALGRDSGWQFYKPGGAENHVQSLFMFEAAAKAFAASLTGNFHGAVPELVISTDSRVD
jgi:hypothetical protein